MRWVWLAKKLNERLRRKVSVREPDFRIAHQGRDYLRRWFVIPRNSVCNIYLHHFLRSDDDRALHDHPYWNVSLLLSGAYLEHTIAAGGVHRRAMFYQGDFKFRTAKMAHRIELFEIDDPVTGKELVPCWSLFITGPRVRDWFFHCPNGLVPWQQFTKPENKGEVGRGCGD